MDRSISGGIIFLLMAALLPFSLAAQQADEGPIREFFTFTLENDFFVDEDDGYTNGMGFTFSKGPYRNFSRENLPGWLHWLTSDLYISTMANKRRGIAHSFLQLMQTPEDTNRTELILDDLPYVGLLGWQGTLYAWDEQLADQLALTLGAVGPVSLAEQTQGAIHDFFNADDPRGWDNQIDNEAVIKLEMHRIWSLYRGEANGNHFDILGLGSLAIGNLESAARMGIAYRWGNGLESSFPAFSLQPDRQVNPLSVTPEDDYYLFIGIAVGHVFNNILIEGNSDGNSHSLPLQRQQDQLSSGAVWSLGRNAFVFQVSSISSPTRITDKRDFFGALSYTRLY